MKKLLMLLCCLLLPLTAFAEGLRMYDENGTFPGNAPVRQYLSDSHCFWGEETVDLGLDRLVPVYAYPSEYGWRAADGKAAVSLREPFTALAWSEDEKWLLIDYTIGESNVLGTFRHRIGYIRRSDLPEGFRCPVSREYLVRVPMRLAREGFLYDDVNGLMKTVGSIPAGETITVLGYVNNAWAYVETQMDGKPARLFMPMAVMEVPAETEDAAMMAALKGTWVFTGGGELLADGVRFDGEGHLRMFAAEDYDHFPPTTLIDRDNADSEYSVYPNLLGDMRYPCAKWVLEVRYPGGGMERMGLILSTDGEDGLRRLDVRMGEGGGGYVQADNVTIKTE